MVSRSYTVAFEGVEARLVEVQCALTAGLPGFSIVGLPDKAVSEARERVRAALATMSVALPARRVTINLSPADLPKVGSHFDLPIALAVLAAIGTVPQTSTASAIALGELSLDGNLIAVTGALPAAMTAAQTDRDLICPSSCGAEAAWSAGARVFAPSTLTEAVQHLSGSHPLAPAEPGETPNPGQLPDLVDVKGQERARRALEIAAAGRHHLLMVGPPGAGKSMLAARLPSILPPLTPAEALETSMIHSVAGLLRDGGISRNRPFRAPHHTASMPALVGGGRNADPGEISLAHNGVLFLDELPEFPRPVLETLRQPLESGTVMVARANAHIQYPCKFLLLAAANPCRCGHLGDANRACNRAPICGEDYMGRISGPLLDRFDLRIEVPAVSMADLAASPMGEASAKTAERVADARRAQQERYQDLPGVTVNADAEGALLERVATPGRQGQTLLNNAAEKLGLSARGYHRTLRTARTIADLEGCDGVRSDHIAEAISYRLASAPRQPALVRAPPARKDAMRVNA